MLTILSDIKASFNVDSVLTTQSRSTQIIYSLLESRPMKVADIKQKTNYSDRTIRVSLQVLLDLQLIRKYQDLDDIRSSFYQVINL